MEQEESSPAGGSDLDFADTLWQAADKLRDYLLPKLLSGEVRVAL